ncbi:MAG: hypothetical protein ACFCGT_22245 [Sandaracinaceae bacterium]
MTSDTRQKIPVPRRFFLWSLNETSGEILTHVGPTEFTPSANDRIVRLPEGGNVETAPMEARPFPVAKDGEYIVLSNPVRESAAPASPNGSFVPGGNKEKDLDLGTKRIIPGPAAFPLWPGQSAVVRPAHKLSATEYLLLEVIGPVDEGAPFFQTVLRAAELDQAVIDAGDEPPDPGGPTPSTGGGGEARRRLEVGQRIVIQGRHTQFFIPPTGIEVVPPLIEDAGDDDSGSDGVESLPAEVQSEAARLVALVRAGLNKRQFSVLKNELRHRSDLPLGHRAVILTALDDAFEDRQRKARRSRSAADARAARDPYARRAVVLGPKEFCVLFDADGKRRIVRGPARVSPGPNDTFMQRGSRRRVYDAYELGEHEALWLRIISPIGHERLATTLPPGQPIDERDYTPGDELIVRGRPSVFFPIIEAEIVHPQTREPHWGNDHDGVVVEAIGIDQKSGIYVRDLRTGMVRMVRGERSHLVDPRSEQHVLRRVPRDQWNLWIGHAEPHKRTPDDFVETPWALSITIPNNEAVLITSRHGRRVEVGPRVVLLEYEEALTALELSAGPRKDGSHRERTAFLRVQGLRVEDTFEVESADFVSLELRLSYAAHFEASSEEGRQRWFQVEDPIKRLADVARARLREAARGLPATRLVREMPQQVRTILLGEAERRAFDDNGMVVDEVDVLGVRFTDPSLATVFGQVQRTAVELQLKDEEASRRLESERHRAAVDEEEHEILRAASRRKAEEGIADVEAQHRVTARAEALHAERRMAAGQAERTYGQETVEAELSRDQARHEAALVRRRALAEVEAETRRAVQDLDEAHAKVMHDLDVARARAVAEAEAIKLTAVQPELVAALHAAADSEVMRSAAENMNLVSLLGGRTPADLFAYLLQGTPLSRTPAGMRQRTGSEGTGPDGSDGEASA